MSVPSIQITGLGKWLGRLHLLHDITLCAEVGQHVMIMGGHGSGKAILLRCMNGMTDFQKGQISIFDTPFPDDPQDILELRRRIGMLTPEAGLFSHLTLLENCLWGPERILNQPRDEVETEAHLMLSRMGVEALADLRPAMLSPEQQLRALLARALCMKPEILLLDDVFHGLGAAEAADFRALLAGLLPELQAEGATIISALNDPELALATADQVIFLDQGHVCERATARQFLGAPQSRAGREFVASILPDPIDIRAETSPDS